jgi:hypothetical protein
MGFVPRNYTQNTDDIARALGGRYFPTLLESLSLPSSCLHSFQLPPRGLAVIVFLGLQRECSLILDHWSPAAHGGATARYDRHRGSGVCLKLRARPTLHHYEGRTDGGALAEEHVAGRCWSRNCGVRSPGAALPFRGVSHAPFLIGPHVPKTSVATSMWQARSLISFASASHSICG